MLKKLGVLLGLAAVAAAGGGVCGGGLMGVRTGKLTGPAVLTVRPNCGIFLTQRAIFSKNRLQDIMKHHVRLSSVQDSKELIFRLFSVWKHVKIRNYV